MEKIEVKTTLFESLRPLWLDEDLTDIPGYDACFGDDFLDDEPTRPGEHDRRAYPRHCAKLPCEVVRYQSAHGGDFRLLSSSTKDISAGGMRVASHQWAGIGDKVLISLKLPETEIHLDLRGEVTHVDESQDSGTLARTLGIWFSDINPVERLMLAATLEDCPATN